MINPKVILDTNVASYLLKGNDYAKLYTKHVNGRLLSITFVTVGEMYYWAYSNNWGERRWNDLEEAFRKYVIVPYDFEISKHYASIINERKRAGNDISSNDAWIAACAIKHGVPLITHNAKHFKGISGLTIITESTSL